MPHFVIWSSSWSGRGKHVDFLDLDVLRFGFFSLTVGVRYCTYSAAPCSAPRESSQACASMSFTSDNYYCNVNDVCVYALRFFGPRFFFLGRPLGLGVGVDEADVSAWDVSRLLASSSMPDSSACVSIIPPVPVPHPALRVNTWSPDLSFRT